MASFEGAVGSVGAALRERTCRAIRADVKGRASVGVVRWEWRGGERRYGAQKETQGQGVVGLCVSASYGVVGCRLKDGAGFGGAQTSVPRMRRALT